MNTKSRIVFVAKLVGLFIVVPYLVAQLTIAIMGAVYPPPAKQLPEEVTGGLKPETDKLSLNEILERSDILAGRLEHKRFLLRSALIAVGIYYVIAIPAFIFVRRKRRNAGQPPLTQTSQPLEDKQNE